MFWINFVDNKVFYNNILLWGGPFLIADFELLDSPFFYEPKNCGNNWYSGKGFYVKIIDRNSTLETKAGNFSNCIVFSNGLVFSPEVGPVILDFSLRITSSQKTINTDEFGGQLNELIYCKINGIEYGVNPLATSVEINEKSAPIEFMLSQNYPNPFNGETVIDFELEKSSEVDLTVCDIQGREVINLLQSNLSAGNHRVSWNGMSSQGRPVPSGVYLMTLKAGRQSQSIKAVHSK